MKADKPVFRKRTMSTEKIIELYKEGMGTTELGKLANVSPRYIRMLLNDNHVERRAHGSWKRKYTVNEDYFKTWSNNMAYILGFFAADGMVARDSQLISFSQKEKYILEDIRQEIGSDHPIYQNKHTNVYMLNLNSKIVKNDMINIHMITHNKSQKIVFPNVPDKYLSHFVRGYFDGDGYINYNKYSVTFVGGSECFMEKLYRIVKNIGLDPQIRSFQNHFRIHITGRKSIKVFSDWIYSNKDLYLKRKYEEFAKEKLEAFQLTDRKDKCTHEAVIARKQNFLDIYEKNKSINQTCEETGLKASTYKRWMKNDILFAHNFNEIDEMIKVQVKK